MRRLLCVLPLLAGCRAQVIIGREVFALVVILVAWAVGAYVERDRT